MLTDWPLSVADNWRLCWLKIRTTASLPATATLVSAVQLLWQKSSKLNDMRRSIAGGRVTHASCAEMSSKYSSDWFDSTTACPRRCSIGSRPHAISLKKTVKSGLGPLSTKYGIFPHREYNKWFVFSNHCHPIINRSTTLCNTSDRFSLAV